MKTAVIGGRKKNISIASATINSKQWKYQTKNSESLFRLKVEQFGLLNDPVS